MNKKLILPIQALITFATAQAANYYVAESGTDSNPGTEPRPFRSIARAMKEVKSNDCVYLAAGIYREIVIPSADGVTFLAKDPANRPVISALEPVTGPWRLENSALGLYATPQNLNPTSKVKVALWQSEGDVSTASGALNLKLKTEKENWDGCLLISRPGVVVPDFFEKSVTWTVEGVQLPKPGSSTLKSENSVLRFSLFDEGKSGYEALSGATVEMTRSESAVSLRLRLKNGGTKTWGKEIGGLSEPGITGFTLRMEPGSGGIAYRLETLPGRKTACSGVWSIRKSEWMKPGSRQTARLGISYDWYHSIAATGQLQASVGLSQVMIRGFDGVAETWEDSFNETPQPLADYRVALPQPDHYVSSQRVEPGTDQLFKGGCPVSEARFPSKRDLSSIGMEGGEVSLDTQYQLTFNGLEKPDPRWDLKGAGFVGLIGPAWAAQTSVVQRKDANAPWRLDPRPANSPWWPNYSSVPSAGDGKGTGYLFGKREFIEARTNDEEWVLENALNQTQTLALRLRNGDSPIGKALERKARKWVVRVEDKKKVSFQNIDFVGGALLLQGSDLSLENCSVRYASHFQHLGTGWGANSLDSERGIVLKGTSHRVSNCRISDTAGAGIYLEENPPGTVGHRIDGNRMENIAYAGSYYAPVYVKGENHQVFRNTISKFGRDGIHIADRETSGLEVEYNDLFAGGQVCKDFGFIYVYDSDAAASSGAKKKRSAIRYNWLHDPVSYPVVGIYLDSAARNYLVSQNVIWGEALPGKIFQGIQLNGPSFGNEIHHNTLIGVKSYNEYSFVDCSNLRNLPGGRMWSDPDYHQLRFSGLNNLVIPYRERTRLFSDFEKRDFRPRSGETFSDKRFSQPVRASAPDPVLRRGAVEGKWSKPAGSTASPKDYLMFFSAASRALPFVLEETAGHGQRIPGVNDGWGDRPASGAYLPGAPLWRAGSSLTP